MSESAPTVYVVDDDASFLKAASRLFRAAGYTVRAYKSGATFLAEVSDAPGCVITDLRMPGLNGLDLQEALARAEHSPPVIFLTGHGDIPTTVRAMRRGAEDFLTKRAPKEELLAAVERALDRDTRRRAERARWLQLRGCLDALTSREREVLNHVMKGQLNKQIAADLNIQERTVKLHRTAITAKLKVRSVAEIALLVREAEAFEEQRRAVLEGT